MKTQIKKTHVLTWKELDSNTSGNIRLIQLADHIKNLITELENFGYLETPQYIENTGDPEDDWIVETKPFNYQLISKQLKGYIAEEEAKFVKLIRKVSTSGMLQKMQTNLIFGTVLAKQQTYSTILEITGITAAEFKFLTNSPSEAAAFLTIRVDFASDILNYLRSDGEYYNNPEYYDGKEQSKPVSAANEEKISAIQPGDKLTVELAKNNFSPLQQANFNSLHNKTCLELANSMLRKMNFPATDEQIQQITHMYEADAEIPNNLNHLE